MCGTRPGRSGSGDPLTGHTGAVYVGGVRPGRAHPGHRQRRQLGDPLGSGKPPLRPRPCSTDRMYTIRRRPQSGRMEPLCRQPALRGLVQPALTGRTALKYSNLSSHSRTVAVARSRLTSHDVSNNLTAPSSHQCCPPLTRRAVSDRGRTPRCDFGTDGPGMGSIGRWHLVDLKNGELARRWDHGALRGN